MPAANESPTGNRLIDAMPHRSRERLLAHSREIRLDSGMVLCESGRPLRHAHFPQAGYLALVATLRGHDALQIGVVGREGMLGASLAQGIDRAPSGAVVQGPGQALRVSVSALRLALHDCAALRRAIHRYLYVLTDQFARSAACARFHAIEPRLARWLLLTSDRARSVDFHMTHKVLADMLGVRRCGVTIAAGILQRARLIHYARGDIRILSRDGLEAVACECYRLSETVARDAARPHLGRRKRPTRESVER